MYCKYDDGIRLNGVYWSRPLGVYVNVPAVIPNNDRSRVELNQWRFDQADCHARDADGCLAMVAECLESLGTDMSATPAMFFPEAIRATVFRKLKEAGVTPGAKV